MRDLDSVFAALARSPFRSRFRLSAKEHAYLHSRTLPAVLDHGRKFLNERLAPALPANDGKQSPMRGHPVFVAQHATATCCRGCLERWHRIPRGRALTGDEQTLIIAAIERWLLTQSSWE
jgi:hypothetical protein